MVPVHLVPSAAMMVKVIGIRDGRFATPAASNTTAMGAADEIDVQLDSPHLL
jgi:hypothetical protein